MPDSPRIATVYVRVTPETRESLNRIQAMMMLKHGGRWPYNAIIKILAERGVKEMEKALREGGNKS